MGYAIDLDRLSLSKYKTALKKKRLTKSRQILHQDTDENFKKLAANGIKTAGELLTALKKNKAELRKQVCADYLDILERELKSNIAKPRKLSDLKTATKKDLDKLAKLKIKSTKDLFNRAYKRKDRKALAKETGVADEVLIKLLKLSDLCRVQWVNEIFALVLFGTGFETAAKVAKAKAETLYEEVAAFNTKEKLYKGKIGLSDMRFCIEAAQVVPAELEI